MERRGSILSGELWQEYQSTVREPLGGKGIPKSDGRVGEYGAREGRCGGAMEELRNCRVIRQVVNSIKS